jgi:hypothetical protein
VIGVVAVRVPHQQPHLPRRQHLIQRTAFEHQGAGQRGVVGFAPRHLGIGFLLRRNGHEVRTEAVAPIDVAQAVEAQVGRRDQLRRHASIAGQMHVTLRAQHGPARQRGAGPVRIQPRQLQEKAAHHLLHGQVVEPRHLYLAQLERTLGGRARGVEEIRIGVARGLQEGVQRRVVHRRAGLRTIGLERPAQPKFGQRREPLLIGQPRRAGDGIRAGGELALATVDRQRHHVERLHGAVAQAVGADHIGTPLVDVVVGLDVAHPDHRAGVEAEQSDDAHAAHDPGACSGFHRPALICSVPIDVLSCGRAMRGL